MTRLSILIRPFAIRPSWQQKTSPSSAQPRPAAFVDRAPFHHLSLTLRSPRPSQPVPPRRTMFTPSPTMARHPRVCPYCPPVIVGGGTTAHRGPFLKVHRRSIYEARHLFKPTDVQLRSAEGLLCSYLSLLPGRVLTHAMIHSLNTLASF